LSSQVGTMSPDVITISLRSVGTKYNPREPSFFFCADALSSFGHYLLPKFITQCLRGKQNQLTKHWRIRNGTVPTRNSAHSCVRQYRANYDPVVFILSEWV
jgi:hypothetical protein